jgi:hypothetical protein
MSPVALATLPAGLLLGHSLQPPFLVLVLFCATKTIHHFRTNKNMETMVCKPLEMFKGVWVKSIHQLDLRPSSQM